MMPTLGGSSSVGVLPQDRPSRPAGTPYPSSAPQGHPPHDGRAPASGSGAGRAPRRPRRRRGPLLLVVLLLLTGLVAGVVWYYGVGRYTTTPGLINLSVAQAREKAADNGLGFEVGDRAFSETVAAGAVIRTEPAPGTDILQDGTVIATVSRGPERYAVPRVAGLEQTVAEDRLTDRNLALGDVVERWSGKVDEGVVIRTDPRPGTELRRDAAVDLVVSKGPRPIEVPDLTGESLEEARAELTDRGFEVSVTREHHDSVPEDDVITQTPTSGTLFRGDTVELVASKGPVMVAVPEVKGAGVDEARAALEAAGFRVRTEHTDVYVGLEYVVKSDPSGGSMAPQGSTVTLYLV